jgi:hypothetical protein
MLWYKTSVKYTLTFGSNGLGGMSECKLGVREDRYLLSCVRKYDERERDKRPVNLRSGWTSRVEVE